MMEEKGRPIGEIIGKPRYGEIGEEGEEILREIFDRFGMKVSMSYHNDCAEIYFKKMGVNVPLDKDFDYWVIHWVLDITHQQRWHKPISLGRVTVAPIDRVVPDREIGNIASRWRDYEVWYPSLKKQQEVFRGAERREEFYRKMGILEQVERMKEIIESREEVKVKYMTKWEYRGREGGK